MTAPSNPPPVIPDPRRNRRVALMSLGVFAAMVGLTYASVPLYRLFCQATGYGGTTQRAAVAPEKKGERTVTVRFDSNISSNLPWSFTPVQLEQTVKLGEQTLAYYRVTNPSDRETVGTAVFNVTPPQAGAYFDKIQCFCFTRQTLKAHETAELPVVYFIDPAIADDPEVSGITTITLSYTFYPADAPEAVSSAAQPAAQTN
jgi:cytochrome c oxidase assembly protein subunit 11